MNNIETPLLINFAPTGMVPTREMSPHVPLQPQDIIHDVIQAANVGITMTHIHARDINGEPSNDKAIYAEIIAGIKRSHPDLILCVTCSGRKVSDFKTRSSVLFLEGASKPDMASLTLSSLNFARSHSENSPETIQKLASCMRDNGIKPELEIFDLGMANYAKYLLHKNFIEEPLYANIMLGNVASAQPSLLELAAIIAALPDSTIWSVAGIGKYQLNVAALGAAYAHGVRIGLEDNLYLDLNRQQLATNLHLVQRVHALAKPLNRHIMSAKQCRELLALS